MSRTYTVLGTWPFPVDMLRYDGSQPATPADKAAVDRLSGEFAPDQQALRVPVAVTLEMGALGRRQPCTARWESFGWQVPADGDYRLSKALAAQEAQREVLRKSALAKLTLPERQALGY